ncbi:MAG: IS1634 family transposase [Anaerolineae bacterium]
MFIRSKKSGSKNSPRDYLPIVESFRDGQSVRQRVICTLGRLDLLQESGQIDALVQNLARFSQTMKALAASRKPQVESCKTRCWGAAMVFDRLWHKQGLPELLHKLSTERRFPFDVERAGFALALQRLCDRGSDLQGSQWRKTVECEGFESLELQHLYRTVGFLHDVRGDLEKELFLRDRDLFSQTLGLLFLDTTSTYVYGRQEADFRKRGYSRDHRGDLLQYVICVAVDAKGWPVTWEIFPGNTADIEAFNHVVARMKQRFPIGKVVVVADRAMLSAETLKLLAEDTEVPFDYILGCKLRKNKEVREQILTCGGRSQKVEDNLEVKEVLFDGRRYIVCRNPEEAKNDEAAREAILDKLKDTIERHGPKALVKNRGYARFVRIRKGAVSINTDAVEADRRFDGKFMLRTNPRLSPAEVAKTSKGLWRVERTFREEKSTLEVRPIHHQRDDTRIGHIVASFLALRLEVARSMQLGKKGIECSWPDLMRDLKRLQAVHLNLDGRSYRVRTDFEGVAYQAFKSAGVQPPGRVAVIN